MQRDDLDRRFNYHRPDEDKAARHQKLRDAARVFADALDENCDEGRELSLAMTNLEQAMFWGNAAVAREQGAGSRTS
jgi:hypothetical protein